MFEYPEYTIRAMTGLRTGDQIGCAYEYNPNGHEYIKQSINEQRYLCSVTDCLGPMNRYRMPGLWSDDTQQSLVLCWAWKQMVDRNLADPAEHPEQVGELFMRVCQKMSQTDTYVSGYFGIHRGTGGNFRSAVQNPAQPPHTAGMGSVMRIGPVATLIPNENQVAEWAVTVSRRTTSDPMGLAAAAYYARAAWRLSRGVGIKTGMADTLRDPEVDECYQQIHLWHEHLKQGGGLYKLPSRRLDETLVAVNQYRQNHNPDLFSGEEPLENFCTGYGPTGVLWALASVHYEWNLVEILSTEDIRGTDTDTIGAICLCLRAMQQRTSVPEWALTQAVPLNIYTWHPIETERALCLQEIDSKINLINTNRVANQHVQS